MSKFAISKAVRDLNSKTLADFLIREIFLRFSVTNIIQFDNASINKSDLISQLLKRVNCSPVFITPFAHQSAGQVERFNRTLDEMISKMIDEKQKEWDLALPICTFNYNTSVHLTTKFMPHCIVFDTLPTLPIDIEIYNSAHAPKLNIDKFRQTVKQNIVESKHICRPI